MATNKQFNYPDKEIYEFVQKELHKRGITAYSIGEIAYEMQHEYLPDYEISDFAEQFNEVLKKREVLNLLAFAFELDNLANKGAFSEPIQSIIENDAGFWQIDEILASSLAQLFGMLAITNYGYLDKKKYGIAKALDGANSITVFSDDIVSALASAVIGRCGHGSKLELDDNTVEEPANGEFSELKFVVNGKEVEPQGDLVYFAKPIKSDRRLPNWDLNKFVHDLGKAIYDSRELADRLEEEFNHDYYVNLEVGMDDESTWQLVIELLDNKMKLVDVINIDVDHFLDYVYLEVDSSSEFVDTAQMIAQFVFEHDLYPYPEDSNDLEESDDEDNELDMSEMTKALAAITPLFMEHFNSLIKSGSLDSLIDMLSDKEDNRKDDANE
ncbi:phosphatidylglycerophosphatase A [Limosilactobacillus reuteri]|uniref:phosphatidylglycerophosphatase A family protein n=1 Tax=Limosilactobacillus reuteri TaxID=1598 RepID=UPI001EE77803|nr:phosphatidylglycerophosphatase A [Limosilactobacillus reuteri]